jgi:hypothetical protein
MRIARQPFTDVGDLLVDHHERGIESFDVRARRPVQHRDELRRHAAAETARLSGRKQERRLIEDQSRAEALVLVRHQVVTDEPIEKPEGVQRILRQAAQVADAPVGEDDHVLESLLVASGERTQTATEVVMEHQRPAAEQLLGQQLAEHHVAFLVVVAGAKQIVRVAVKNERGRRPRKIQVGQLRRPRREPSREIGRPPASHGSGDRLGRKRLRRHAARPPVSSIRESPAVPRAGRRAPSGAGAR